MVRPIAEYDVALSFAGEDRPYVSKVAELLKDRGVRVFYDEFEKVDLWGKDLYQHLSDVYLNRADYTIIFASTHYANKLWPRHELRNAQARAFEDAREYILPARFDDTEIPGVLATQGYIDLRNHTPEEFAQLVIDKLGRSQTLGFHIATIERRVRRADSEDGPWQNAHSLTFSVRNARPTEINLVRSTAGEPKSVLEIAFVFSPSSPVYMQMTQSLENFVADQHLKWISWVQQGSTTRYTIDGQKLLLFLPKLDFVPWIATVFQVHPAWRPGPRLGTDDPSNSGSVTFELHEP